jgi:hypothetical protein
MMELLNDIKEIKNELAKQNKDEANKHVV